MHIWGVTSRYTSCLQHPQSSPRSLAAVSASLVIAASCNYTLGEFSIKNQPVASTDGGLKIVSHLVADQHVVGSQLNNFFMTGPHSSVQ